MCVYVFFFFVIRVEFNQEASRDCTVLSYLFKRMTFRCTVESNSKRDPSAMHVLIGCTFASKSEQHIYSIYMNDMVIVQQL